MDSFKKERELNPFEELFEGIFKLLTNALEILIDLLLELLKFFWSLFFNLIKKHIFKQEIKKDIKKITEEDLAAKNLNFKNLETIFKDKNKTPIGLSLIDKKPICLDLKARCEHTIVTGATGVGKTTLLKTLLNHSLKHNHPAIIIDPKGQKEDTLEIREKAKLYRKKDDFILFSLSFPNESCSYNPLQNGTAEQIKARLIDGLYFEHSYYRAQSALWLSAILSTLKFLNKTITFNLLRKLLSDKIYIEFLNKEIKASKSDKKSDMLLFLNSTLQIKKEDLAGLLAQISSFDSPRFSEILSPKSDSLKPNLSLCDVLQHKKIAYFQMNTNGYGGLSRSIGKMIVQDLKVLSNQIQCGQRTFDYDFCPIFIDEFGSFATSDFADFLKMARSSRMALHLFFQGLSDLDVVNLEFKNQILGNTIYKILFRQDIPNDVEVFSEMAGTFKSNKKTYQLEDTNLNEELTGKGSLREVREMKIEFDVFKRLSIGEAILIDKKRHREDLFKVWLTH